MKILLYGPLGYHMPKEKIGGAEVGCRRSVELLKDNGYDVTAIEKPTNDYGVKHFLKEFYKAFKLIKNKLKTEKDSVFYLVGFYDRQILFEHLLCRLAKKYKHKVIYEPKNGGMVNKYKTGNKLYRYLSNAIYKASDIIFCQGLEYVEFLNELGYKNAVYQPNYVNSKNLSLAEDKREEELACVFVGRVGDAKNVGVIVDIFADIFKEKNNAKLYLVGSYTEDYKVLLDEKIKSYSMTDAVTFTGRVDFEKIAEYLNKSHFFLFPSKEKNEGHSNALTEAMGFGVVPVASEIGFNRSVIGNDELLVSGYNPQHYSKIVLNVWENGRWNSFSESVKKRVHENFSEEKVRQNYLNTINKLF